MSSGVQASCSRACQVAHYRGSRPARQACVARLHVQAFGRDSVSSQGADPHRAREPTYSEDGNDMQPNSVIEACKACVTALDKLDARLAAHSAATSQSLAQDGFWKYLSSETERGGMLFYQHHPELAACVAQEACSAAVAAVKAAEHELEYMADMGMNAFGALTCLSASIGIFLLARDAPVFTAPVGACCAVGALTLAGSQVLHRWKMSASGA
eukprot:TRINITY_DN4734_c0_g1_i1.p2 TRINITY_DN4734_c0_g1~~TRINITY_DN4734_c0_g1_i1.p2  ORF type:complete len:213 (-),score=30.50 TRINITY_DN4734_c0_g1_i1:518-1156(-)